MLLVVVLTVRRDRAEDFHRFETAAARIMARHGGAMERTVRLDEAPRTARPPLDDSDAEPRATAAPEAFREVHLVRFPSEDAFRAYRADPELGSLAPLRAASIIATEIWPGTDGPTYR